MVKHTQTIRWQFVDELFECVWSFYEIGAERVNLKFLQTNIHKTFSLAELFLEFKIMLEFS